MSKLVYQNTAMSHAEAHDIAIDLGLVITHRDARNQAVPGTSRVRITPSGDGFDVVIPAEHAARIVQAIKGRLLKLGILDPLAPTDRKAGNGCDGAK